MLQRGVPRDADLHCLSFSLLCPINELRGERWGSALDADPQTQRYAWLPNTNCDPTYERTTFCGITRSASEMKASPVQCIGTM